MIVDDNVDEELNKPLVAQQGKAHH